MRWLRLDEWEFGHPGAETLEIVVSSPRQHSDFPTFVAQVLMADSPAGEVTVTAAPPRTWEELRLVEWAMGQVERRAGVELLGEPSLCDLFVATVTPDRREMAVNAGEQFAVVRWERRKQAEPSATADRPRE